MCKKIVLIGVLLCFVAGCSGPTFKPLSSDFHAKESASLAVVSGLKKSSNAQLAHYLTEAFKAQSTYRVLSQAAIAKAVKGYPYNIQGPYSSAYFEIKSDFDKTDLEMIRQLQKKLGVDYLFVIWAPLTTTFNQSAPTIHVVSQMFESPGAREVGQGNFFSTAHKFSIVHRDATAEEVKKGMERTAKVVALELSAKTGMSR